LDSCLLSEGNMQLMELSLDQELARETVAKLSNKGLKPEEITGEMVLNQDLGIDSLQFIRLILEIERRSSRRIFNVQVIAQIKTFNDLCAAVAAR
jgi:acyl carrier protein